MPTPYMMPSVPNRYPIDRNDKIGLAIGALLSGGLAAASSGNTGENPILRAIAGGVTGLGAGGKHLNDSYSAMLDDYLKNDAMDFRNKQFGQQVREYEETDKPYKEAMTRYNESLMNKAETPKLPNEVQNWQFGMDIKDPRQRSEFLDRTMPLKTNKPLTGKVKSYDDYLSDISKVEKQLADLQVKNIDGNYDKAIDSLVRRRDTLMRGAGLQNTIIPKNVEPATETTNKKEWYKWR